MSQPMTKVQIDTAFAALENRFRGSLACPACRGSKFHVQDHLYGYVAITPDIGHTGDVFPVVLAGCDQCGYVMSFSAEALGVIPPRAE